MARLPNQDWFKEPQGADCPDKLFVSAKQSRPCRATFIGTDFNGYLECRMRLILDSQQPRVILSIANDMGAIKHGGHLVYTAQDNDFHMGIEKPGNAAAEEIRQLKSAVANTPNGSKARDLFRLSGSSLGSPQSKWERPGCLRGRN